MSLGNSLNQSEKILEFQNKMTALHFTSLTPMASKIDSSRLKNSLLVVIIKLFNLTFFIEAQSDHHPTYLTR
jgi:hypothetical protein